jgi:predicted lipoprotein with Yx(FWY)xxD motif
MKANRPVYAGLAVLVGFVVVVLAVSGGSSERAQPRVAAGSAVSVAHSPLGQTLVDANGRTLYLFQADKPSISTVSQAGLAVWPAFTATTTPQARAGATATMISTTTGSGGSRQVTYNGHPLYYYVGDKQPGDAHGQRLNQFGAVWYVISPSGHAVTSPVPAVPTQPAQPSGGGSPGY